MGENSKIEWCDHTWNPWEGCQKVGPGCDHCYAETRNARFGGGIAPNWGPGAPRRRTSVSNWKSPKNWQRQASQFYAKHGRRQRVFAPVLRMFSIMRWIRNGDGICSGSFCIRRISIGCFSQSALAMSETCIGR